jgi:hypothetical protein
MLTISQFNVMLSSPWGWARRRYKCEASRLPQWLPKVLSKGRGSRERESASVAFAQSGQRRCSSGRFQESDIEYRVQVSNVLAYDTKK